MVDIYAPRVATLANGVNLIVTGKRKDDRVNIPFRTERKSNLNDSPTRTFGE